MRFFLFFIFLLTVLFSCSDKPKTRDLRGSWSLKAMVNEDSANTQDEIMNSAISQGSISGTIVFENDSLYSMSATSLGFGGQSEKGKYWLSSDGKLLQMLAEGDDETKKIEVVSISKDTLQVKFNPTMVSIFLKEKD